MGQLVTLHTSQEAEDSNPFSLVTGRMSYPASTATQKK